MSDCFFVNFQKYILLKTSTMSTSRKHLSGDKDTHSIMECKRCGHTSSQPSDLLKHLKRKRTCSPTKQNIDVTDLIAELTPEPKEKPHECANCGKTFTTRQAKSRHMKGCQSVSTPNDIEILKQQLLQQQKSIVALQQQLACKSNAGNNNTTNHNHGTINNNIHIHVTPRSFGNENMDAIPDSFLANTIMDLQIRNLIKELHFDPEYPENHNIRLLSTKQQLMQMYLDDKWQTIPMLKGISDLIEQATSKFMNYYNKNQANVIEDVGDDEAKDLLNKLRNLEARSMTSFTGAFQKMYKLCLSITKIMVLPFYLDYLDSHMSVYVATEKECSLRYVFGSDGE